MVTLGRLIGKLASVFVISEVGGKLIAEIAGFVHLSVYALIIGIVSVVMATNSEKSRSTEQRVDNTVIPAIGALNQGTFNNVGGQSVQLFGGGSLNVAALSQFSNQTACRIANGLSLQGRPPTVQSPPGSYAQSWGQNIVDVCNGIIATLGVEGLMT